MDGGIGARKADGLDGARRDGEVGCAGECASEGSINHGIGVGDEEGPADK